MKNYAKVHESFDSFSEFVEKLTFLSVKKEKTYDSKEGGGENVHKKIRKRFENQQRV